MRTIAGAAGAGEQMMVTLPVSVQSPSLTVSVTVETPAVVQSSVGFGVVGAGEHARRRDPANR